MAVASCFLAINLADSQINISANNQHWCSKVNLVWHKLVQTLLQEAFEPNNKVASLSSIHPQSITSGRAM